MGEQVGYQALPRVQELQQGAGVGLGSLLSPLYQWLGSVPAPCVLLWVLFNPLFPDPL